MIGNFIRQDGRLFKLARAGVFGGADILDDRGERDRVHYSHRAEGVDVYTGTEGDLYAWIPLLEPKPD